MRWSCIPYVCCLFILNEACAQTWVGGSSGDWSLATNWNPAIVPNNPTTGVWLQTVTSINVAGTFAIGTLSFNSTGVISLSNGPGQLNLGGGGTPSAIYFVGTGPYTIATALNLLANSTVQLDSSQPATISGKVSGAFGLSLTGSGPGPLIFSGMNNYTGETTVGVDATLQAGAENSFSPGSPLTVHGTLNVAGFSNVIPSLGGDGVIAMTSGEVLTVSNGGTFTGAITGTGALLLTGGNLTLSGLNSYTDGTTINSGATLTGTTDGLQGVMSNEGLIVFDQAFAGTYGGAISGSGSLTLSGGGTLTLTGANSYSGGTNILGNSTLVGEVTTPTLQGNILIDTGSHLQFVQGRDGTFESRLSGDGEVRTSGVGTLTFSADNFDFTGPVQVMAPSGLKVDRFLGYSLLVTVDEGAHLSGTGTVGPTQNSGTITPGNSIGTLTVNGPLTLQGSSALNIEVEPHGNSSRLLVHGPAHLNGTVQFSLQDGFYGPETPYLFLDSSDLMGTTFSSFALTPFSNPTATGVISYGHGSAILLVKVLEPFYGFLFANANERHVGENIDQLNSQGLLTPELILLLDSLAGASTATINHTLDELHPAPYSAFEEIQTEVGDQLLTLFHRKPHLRCGCKRDRRLWAVPLGSWLKEGNVGEQTGFEAITYGLALGYDQTLGAHWALGGAAAWSYSDLTLHLGKGSGQVNRFLGAFYSDYMLYNWYLGTSLYAGWDQSKLTRYIQFPRESRVERIQGVHLFPTEIQLTAHGALTGPESALQVATAYLFGVPAALFYPYANCDLFYSYIGSFTESGAQAVDLTISSHSSLTLRSSAGVALQIQDSNFRETVCISPTFALGWAMECPLWRPDYTAHFAKEPISFTAHGWNQTWQLFTIDFGLKISLWDWALWGEYHTEITPEGRDTFWNQRCNIGLSWSW